MLKKVLIANRGEIAVRVIRTCQEMGIATVAVHSEADDGALHVRYADEAYPLGDPTPAQSYLNVDKIIEASIELGVDGIHPGYGFLAENSKFAKACEDNGIKFIGPSSVAIEKMGNKVEARKIMRDANIPITPGSKEAMKDLDDAIGTADSIGYPIMLKASAGGGGIGMRIVRQKGELKDAMESAQAQAKSAFGNPEIFMEKFIEEPRHIEFQILADRNGGVVHLGERECSIQRKYQKLIEEAPSPIMTSELRKRMGEVSIDVAKTIGYESAGTVEFIFSKGEFYFNEMNTRLQVEHPVTEMITGLDLVREQLRLAAGEEIGYFTDDIAINGWAMECRINAEDPLNNFFPSPGTITGYQVPGGHGVRVDSGVYSGFTIPMYYDSLIAKLIVWGRDRREAMAHMQRALGEYIIEGIKTNIPLHKLVLSDDDFQEGNIDTSFIKKRKMIEGLKDSLTFDIAEVGAKVDDETQLAAVIGAAIAAHVGTMQKINRISKVSYDDRDGSSGWGVSRWGRTTTSPWAFAGRLEQMGYKTK